MNHSNSKRLLKNTVFLYLRLILTLTVALYTSREVIGALGITDYGIFNVVAGAVTMLTFLNSAMATGTQRFLSFEMGKASTSTSTSSLSRVFNTSIIIHLAIALLFFISGEVTGNIMLKKVLTIPEDRLQAASWVLHCAILAAAVEVIRVPFVAMIIAYERMGIYAYMSIIDAILKLGIVYILLTNKMDPLKLYGLLFLCASATTTAIYIIYCNSKFTACKFKGGIDKKKIWEISTFVGWNISAQIAYAMNTQGVNMLLNVFFGPAINAARGVAVQASGTIRGFVSNFQVAASPQIVKAYSSGQLSEERKLIFFACKLTFILLFLMACPVFLETNFLLNLWLKEPPPLTAIFLKIILINELINTSVGPMYQAIMATGEIKKFQILYTIIIMSGIAISWALLHLGLPAYSVFITSIFCSAILLLKRLDYLKVMIDLKRIDYWNNVAKPGIKVLLLSTILPTIIHFAMDEGFLRFIFVGFTVTLGTVITTFCFALSSNEKNILTRKLKLKLKIANS